MTIISNEKFILLILIKLKILYKIFYNKIISNKL